MHNFANMCCKPLQTLFKVFELFQIDDKSWTFLLTTFTPNLSYAV